MNYESILLQVNHECAHCTDTIPAGEYALQDTQEKTIFCSEVCWAREYNVDGAAEVKIAEE